MAAAKGNKYNEIWTEAKTIQLFENAVKIAMDDDSIISLSSIAVKQETYVEKYWELEKKFPANKRLQAIKKEIDHIIVHRLVTKGSTSKINPVFAMFLLKCKHGYVDVQKVDHSSTDGSMSPKPVIKVSNQEAKRELMKLAKQN